MTFNTKDLRDGHLPLVERIDIALRRVTNGEGQMRVPVEATDPDIVLHNCRDRITELEGLLSEHEGITRSAVAQTMAGTALAVELAKALAEIERLRPAAALGNAYLASIDEDADDNDVADLQDALEVAADRARGARS